MGAGDRNYFASVLEELRKVVWPSWNELGRMTGVVVTTVVLMAVIVSAADYGLGLVVKQLYASSSPAAPGSTVQPSVVKPSAKASATAAFATTAPTSAGSTAPVSP